jgi:hypothetical protein
MTHENIQELAEKNAPCIVVCPRQTYNSRRDRWEDDGLTVVAESSPNIGRSRGVHSRYDYGFMQLDIRDKINVFVIANPFVTA